VNLLTVNLLVGRGQPLQSGVFGPLFCYWSVKLKKMERMHVWRIPNKPLANDTRANNISKINSYFTRNIMTLHYKDGSFNSGTRTIHHI